MAKRVLIYTNHFFPEQFKINDVVMGIHDIETTLDEYKKDDVWNEKTASYISSSINDIHFQFKKFLSLIALPFGLITSYLIVEYYSVVGIDLSVVEAWLENFGVGTRLYFKVPNEEYFYVSLMVFVISSLACPYDYCLTI